MCIPDGFWASMPSSGGKDLKKVENQESKKWSPECVHIPKTARLVTSKKTVPHFKLDSTTKNQKVGTPQKVTN